MSNDDTAGRYNHRVNQPTHVGIAEMREQIDAVAQEHAADRALLTKLIRWIVGLMGTALVAGFVPLVSTLIGVGEVREQQRAMRSDVSAMLALSRSLERDQATTKTQVDGVEGALHQLESKVWEVTRAQRERERAQ